ncbi:MAG: hypothetical protein VKL39_02265 [Leptolyngbyaceae bacterium]|nr:hypothetical protein [Leptolyngbyaceae bacterium]
MNSTFYIQSITHSVTQSVMTLIEVTAVDPENTHRFPTWLPLVLIVGFTAIAAIAISVTQSMESQQPIDPTQTANPTNEES